MKIQKSFCTGMLPPGEGNPRNSEGAFLTLEDGRIAFAYSRFIGNSWDDHAASCISVIYSHDNGDSWDTEHYEILVRAEEYGQRNVMSVSLVRMNNGDIGLFYGLKEDGGMRDRYLLRRYQGDFDHPCGEVCCLPTNYPGYYVINNDRVVHLSDGTWMIPCAHHPSSVFPREGYEQWMDSRGTAVFFVSKDDGRTWRQTHAMLNHPNEDCGTGLQEPGVLELPGGTLYSYFRTNYQYHYESVSIDGGERWFMPRPSQFTGPDSPLSIKKNPYSGKYYAVWNPIPNAPGRNASPHSWGRTPLVMAESADGVHFEKYLTIENDPERGFCYPAIYFLDERTLLLAYCSGGKEDGCVLSRTTLRKVILED